MCSGSVPCRRPPWRRSCAATRWPRWKISTVRLVRREEAGGLDVVVEIDPGEPPLGVLVVVARQRSQGWPLEALEELAPADPETAHHVGIDALHRGGDR